MTTERNMAQIAYEVNFDGIVGPTHNYGGLSYGNVASMKNRASVSNPRAALFQCLDKMMLLASLGIKQAMLPPQARPDFGALRRLGYSGNESRILDKIAKEDPELLAGCFSSSSMWAANAATVSPSPDTKDGLVHFTPANLVNHFHRSIETPFTGAIVREIFKDETKFVHHMPLPGSLNFSDEGAANHTRFCESYGDNGIEFFVYGRRDCGDQTNRPALFPARQTYEASASVARLHRLDPNKTVFAKQNPEAVDAGVFHNDVISVGNKNVFLCHAEAFSDFYEVTTELKNKFEQSCGCELTLIEVCREQISLTDAVESYLFNSQLVSTPDGGTCLIAPSECQDNPRVRGYLEQMVFEDNPIDHVFFVDVGQSMKNGGGPACMRLRVVLTEEELSCTHPGVFFSAKLYDELVQWGNRHYRDQIQLEDLVDPKLLEESRYALDSLTEILGLGSIYDFQRQ